MVLPYGSGLQRAFSPLTQSKCIPRISAHNHSEVFADVVRDTSPWDCKKDIPVVVVDTQEEPLALENGTPL
jgi:hypothetical protein